LNLEKPLTLQGKFFDTAIKAITDVAGGGHLFYITYKKRLYFSTENKVELSWIIMDDHWSWPDYFSNSKYAGIYEKTKNGHYTLDCELKHMTQETTLKIAALLVRENELLCECYFKSEAGEIRESEIFMLAVE